MKLIKTILQSYFLMLVYALGLYDDEDTAVVKQREKACEECPLRTGQWCDSKKTISIQTTEKAMNPLGFEDWVYKKVVGCGCWLIAKFHARTEPQETLCPKQAWSKYKN